MPAAITNSCTRIELQITTQPLFQQIAQQDILKADSIDVMFGGLHVDVEKDVFGSGRDVIDNCYKRELIDHILVTLHALRKGGTLVLVVGDCTTRFMLGILYMLYRFVCTNCECYLSLNFLINISCRVAHILSFGHIFINLSFHLTSIYQSIHSFTLDIYYAFSCMYVFSHNIYYWCYEQMIKLMDKT